MADLERVKASIAELSTRKRCVRFEEIERIVKQLSKLGFTTNSRHGTHGDMFQVEDETFQVSRHTKDGFVKSYAVKDFLDAMTSLGLFD